MKTAESARTMDKDTCFGIIRALHAAIDMMLLEGSERNAEYAITLSGIMGEYIEHFDGYES